MEKWKVRKRGEKYLATHIQDDRVTRSNYQHRTLDHGLVLNQQQKEEDLSVAICDDEASFD